MFAIHPILIKNSPKVKAAQPSEGYAAIFPEEYTSREYFGLVILGPAQR